MKTRVITGAVYVLVLVLFFLLKAYVHAICFDVLIWLFAIVGTHEMLHAFADRLTLSQRVLAQGFAVLYLPIFVLFETVWGTGIYAMAALFAGIAALQLCLFVFDYEKVSPEGVGLSLLASVYPQLLLGVLALCNHLARDSMLALLCIFVISPCADSVAYLFGVALHKKFPKPMAPRISPNKTLIGGLGGLVGGVLGAILLYLIYNAVVGITLYDAAWLNVLVFGLIGLVAALFTAFGDLVESAIKRKVGIKDMGKLLPGHGGILDRIDGSMFLTLFIYVVFVLFSL